MSESHLRTHEEFVLPPSIMTRIDVAHLVEEVERVDSELTSAAVRKKTGSDIPAKPVVSSQLRDFLHLNDVVVSIDSHARTTLIQELRKLKDTVPTIHMTFAVSADAESLERLTQWVRETIHPQAVLKVGLQPSLIAGVYIRTPNHVHDLSLRAQMKGKRHILVKQLEALRAGGQHV